MPPSGPMVFISYSHDSPEHGERVLKLANRLRSERVNAAIDQYELAPPERWSLWMTRQIQDSDFVLLVCTKTYRRRVENRETPDKGFGVRWEGSLILNSLYDERTLNKKFIPILYTDCSE